MTTNPLDFSDPRLCIGEAAFAASGATSRDSSEYEALEQWIRRLETEGPAAVDWPEVVRLATTILEARGKDLVVGCWLAYGLFHAEGYRGLAVGLGILRGLVLHHWETMQPPVTRKRARIGAVEWLAGRAAHLCQAEPDAEEAGAVLYAFAALGEIEQAIGERLPKDPVSLRDLTRGLAPKREAIRRALEQARRQRQEQEEEEAARARLPVPTPTPPAPPRPAPPVLDPKALDALPETMKTLAAGLLAADTTDARAYTLSRVASWSRIRQLPPHDGGRTGAMPPVEEATTLRDLCQRGENAAALSILNDLVWSAPFWFEGHRITAELLLRSGPDHADAHAAVCGAMPLLLRRFPALVTFTFADGTPLAEAETQTWLIECGGSASPPDGLDRALKEVRQLMAAGKGREAVDRMAALTEESGSGRDRLLRQIAQARFCLDVGLVAAALPLLDHLDQMLEAHGLESWEPSLAAQVAELRFRALTHPDAFKLVPEDRRRLGLDLTRQRLVRLDFATAARLFR